MSPKKRVTFFLTFGNKKFYLCCNKTQFVFKMDIANLFKKGTFCQKYGVKLLGKYWYYILAFSIISVQDICLLYLRDRHKYSVRRCIRLYYISVKGYHESLQYRISEEKKIKANLPA